MGGLALEVYGSPVPRIATPQPAGDEAVSARIDRIERLAVRHFGLKRLHDWQRLFLEYLITDLPQMVGLLVARQQGKTTVMQAYLLDCVLQGERVLSCAQSLGLSTDTWREVAELFDPHKDSDAPYRHLLKRIDWSAATLSFHLSNGGAWYVRAANRKAARGIKKIDKTWYDEARHLADAEAFNAINPTMTMSAAPQAIFTSNAGDLKSTFMNTLQARGRKAAAGLSDDPIVWLEWSADPGLDHDDQAGWAQANPALGHGFTLATLEADHRTYLEAGNLDGWRTERLCQQVGALGSALDVNAFRRLYDPDAEPPKPGDKGLWMSFTVDLNRRGAATLIGRQLPDGRSQVGILSHWDAQPGEEVSDRDVANRVVEEYQTWKPRGIAYNSFVAAGVAHLLTRRRLPLEDYKGRRYFDSCQMFAELIRTGMLTHDNDPALSDHVSVAVREDLRNGEGWFLSRRRSPGPIYCADGMAMISHATSRRRSQKSGIVTLSNTG